MQDGRFEPLDGALDDQFLVHRTGEIVAAEILPEEPQVEVGMESAVAQPDPAEMVAEGQGVRRGAPLEGGARRAGQVVGGPLVGVEAQDAGAPRFAAGELVLAGEVVEGPRDDARSRLLRDAHRRVARAAVDDQHFVAESAHRGDAGRDPLLLVLGHHHRGEAQRRSSRMRERTSVVEWSFGSPAMAVRPPRRATTSPSGTEASL